MAIKTNISLKKYKWTRRNKISIVGWVWYEKEYLEGEDFLRLIGDISNTLEDFQTSLKLLNGQFSILIEKENNTWLASSHTWDFPLFYSNCKNEWRISDLLDRLYERHEGMREWDRQLLVAIDCAYAERDSLLRDGQEIAIMPPVQGG